MHKVLPEIFAISSLAIIILLIFISEPAVDRAIFSTESSFVTSQVATPSSLDTLYIMWQEIISTLNQLLRQTSEVSLKLTKQLAGIGGLFLGGFPL